MSSATSSVAGTWNDSRAREVWVVVGLLFAVTIVHTIGEVFLDFGPEHGGIHSGLHHVPAMVYLVPVAYAGLVFGLRGGLLAGVASLLLTIPNMVLWHRHEYAWIGEAFFMLFIVMFGAGLAFPATRERRHRRTAEQEVRRLAVLNEIASSLSASLDVETSSERAVELTMKALNLEGAGLALWTKGSTDPFLLTSSAVRSDVCELLEDAVLHRVRRAVGAGPKFLPGGIIGVAVIGTSVSGALAVLPRDHAPEKDVARLELLETVANQIAIGLENIVLQQGEQQRLRNFVDLATRLQESERARLAREIHDDTAQSMALICRGLHDASKRADAALADGPLGLHELTRLSQETLQSLRNFARNARPATLDDLGLVPSLEWLAGDLERRSGITTSLTVQGPVRRIDSESEVTAFRIVQEALRNIEQHARASSGEIRVSYSPDGLRIEIIDDGRGFEPPEHLSYLVREEKLGLVGMRERARLVGGSLEIQTTPGDGTVIAVELHAAGPNSR